MHLEKGLHGGAAGPAQRAGHPDRECPACHRTAPASRGAARGSRHASDTASGEASDSSWCFGTMRSAAARKPASGRSQRSSSVARASTAGAIPRGDRLPSAGGRPEQMSVRAPASWDLSLTRGVESTHPCPPTRPPRGACVAVTPNLVWIAQVGDCVQVLYDRGRSCARGGGRGDGSWHATKGTRAPHGRLRVRSGNVHVIVAAIGYRM